MKSIVQSKVACVDALFSSYCLSHSCQRAKHILKATVAIAAVAISFSTSLHAKEPTRAIQAAKADRSMLLDVARAGNHIVAVGERGHILVSEDTAANWQQADVPVAQMLTAVSFPSSKVGYAVGHDSHIVRSEDGGQTWTLIRDGLKAQAALNELAVKDWAAELSRVQGLIDQGLEFDPEQPMAFEGMSLIEQLDEVQWYYESAQDKLSETITAPPLMDVWFSNEELGYAAGAFGKLFKTEDGGQTWQNLSGSIGNIDEFHLNAITGAHGGSIYVAGEAGFLVYSHDNGSSWQQADLGYDGTIFGLIASKDGASVIATGLRGNTFISRDKGLSWQPLATGVDYSLSSGLLFGDASLILVGAGGNIALSQNNSESFEQFILPARASLSAVVALPENQFLLVGQGGFHRFQMPVTAQLAE
ncbi:MAG: hypothetical protein HRU21_08840 [Pseudomonadales bacterium]|nr:hypothetical protein [Pseudomonadales bacterium]